VARQEVGKHTVEHIKHRLYSLTLLSTTNVQPTVHTINVALCDLKTTASSSY